MNRLLLAPLAILAAGPVTGCVVDDDGSMSLTWRLESGGAEIDCAVVGGDRVLVVDRDFDDILIAEDCDRGFAAVSVVPGSYSVEVQLVDSANDPLNTREVSGRVNVVDGLDTDIGNFVFSFDTDLRFRYEIAGAATPGSLGLQSQRVNLVAPGTTTCTPYDIELLGAAGQPIVDQICTTNLAQGESTEQRILDVELGTYELYVDVFGTPGATGALCYRSNPADIDTRTYDGGVILFPLISEPFDDCAPNAPKPASKAERRVVVGTHK